LINPARVSKQTNQTKRDSFAENFSSDTPADPHLRGDLAEPGTVGRLKKKSSPDGIEGADLR